MARLSTSLKVNPSTKLRIYKKKSSRKRSARVRYFLNLILALGLVIGGATLIFWSTLSQGFSLKLQSEGFGWPATESPSHSQVQQTQAEVNSKPSKIYISKLNRNLDISDGFVENNRWVISKTGVSYLTTSGEVGKVGNAVIYGHNTQGILGGLWRVQNGDVVEVTAVDGKVYKYQIFERKEVKPNQVEILTQTDDARLTVYTCSGFLESARFVVVGNLVEGY